MARMLEPLPDLQDDSLMPQGKHKGTPMIDVPAKHLLYIYENEMANDRVKKYVEDNLDVIRQQAKQE